MDRRIPGCAGASSHVDDASGADVCVASGGGTNPDAFVDEVFGRHRDRPPSGSDGVDIGGNEVGGARWRAAVASSDEGISSPMPGQPVLRKPPRDLALVAAARCARPTANLSVGGGRSVAVPFVVRAARRSALHHTKTALEKLATGEQGELGLVRPMARAQCEDGWAAVGCAGAVSRAFAPSLIGVRTVNASACVTFSDGMRNDEALSSMYSEDDADRFADALAGRTDDALAGRRRSLQGNGSAATADPVADQGLWQEGPPSSIWLAPDKTERIWPSAGMGPASVMERERAPPPEVSRAGPAGWSVEARCASREPFDAVGATLLTLQVKSPTLGEWGQQSAVARCPYPFSLASCGCYSRHGLCLGARPMRDDVYPQRSDVCVAKYDLPLVWWHQGASAVAQCVWAGDASLLMRAEDSSGGGTCAPIERAKVDATRKAIPLFAYLPASWHKLAEAAVSSTATLGYPMEGTRSRFPGYPAPGTFAAASLLSSSANARPVVSLLPLDPIFLPPTPLALALAAAVALLGVIAPLAASAARRAAAAAARRLRSRRRRPRGVHRGGGAYAGVPTALEAGAAAAGGAADGTAGVAAAAAAAVAPELPPTFCAVEAEAAILVLSAVQLLIGAFWLASWAATPMAETFRWLRGGCAALLLLNAATGCLAACRRSRAAAAALAAGWGLLVAGLVMEAALKVLVASEGPSVLGWFAWTLGYCGLLAVWSLSWRFFRLVAHGSTASQRFEALVSALPVRRVRRPSLSTEPLLHDGDGGGGGGGECVACADEASAPAAADGSDCSDLPTCAICLSHYEAGEHVTTLHCRHAFHAKCIVTWLRRPGQRLRAKCPLCNAYVFKGFAPPPPPDTGDDDDDDDVEMVELGERRDSE